MGRPRILVVENSAASCSLLVKLLSPHYDVVDTASAELAFDLVLNGEQFDIVLCDMCLTGWSGADFYRRLQRRLDRHASVFVMLSGIDVAGRYPALAAELGPRLLSKPFLPPHLLEVLAIARADVVAA